MWDDFAKKYLGMTYPGHDLPLKERREAEKAWPKSRNTMKREQIAINNFGRIIRPGWCHEITAEHRELFIQSRLPEVGSALSVDAELRTLRLLCNIMKEWKHRSSNENPFAGRGKASVGNRRKRNMKQEKTPQAKHFARPQIVAILNQADAEAAKEPTWEKKRLRVLIYFVAYTGARIKEALHVEWDDIDLDEGIAWLFFKVENALKTEGSEAPFGLPDCLVAVLREWQKERSCTWVFPNSVKKPWTSGAPGYRPFDQLQEIAKRAGVEHANWKMFRHSFDTHGKGHFGLTREQIKNQLRHSTEETQKHYDHDDLQNLHEAVRNIDFRK